MKIRILIALIAAGLLVGGQSYARDGQAAIPTKIPLKKDNNGCSSPDPSWSPPGGGTVSYNPPPPWCGSGPVTVCFTPGGCYQLTVPDGTVGPLPKATKAIPDVLGFGGAFE